MKYLITYLFIAFSIIGITQNSDFEQGNSYHINGQYEEAISEYNSAIDQGFLSSDLFYNLGNSYYRNNQLGEGVWAYEKALKLEPGNTNAKENLDFLVAQTEDKIDNSKPGIGTWIKKQLFGFGVNFWAYASIFTSGLLSLSMLMFFKSQKRRQRNIGMLVGAFSALILIIAIISANMHKTTLSNTDFGIIISEKVEVKISPLEKAEKSFALSEGTKVSLIDKKDNWIQIELNGNSGWVQKDNIWDI